MPRSLGVEQQQSYSPRVAGEGRRTGSRKKVIEYELSYLNCGTWRWGAGWGAYGGVETSKGI